MAEPDAFDPTHTPARRIRGASFARLNDGHVPHGRVAWRRA